MVHFGMKLKTKDFLFVVADGSDDAIFAIRFSRETLGKRPHVVAVRHPHRMRSLRQERGFIWYPHFRQAVFALA